MLSIVLKLVGDLYGAALRHSVRRMMLTAALMLLALSAWIGAAGFGLSLAYVWLQRSEGTMAALAIVGAGCVALGLILLLGALLARRQRRWRGASGLSGGTSNAERVPVERMLEEAVAAIQGSSRESILAAAALALAAGMVVGRRL
jgi:hypothetical protein